MVNPREPSTDEDREAMALCCVWKADAEAAEFLHLNTAMFQCVGRGSEVAGGQKTHITSKQKNEPLLTFKILSHYLKCHKNDKEQNMDIFPDRVGL